ncbi:hypothetical protein [Streptomyces sp. NPDC057438]|uniref:hypothetical protein n=1 Tax=Streptomyces sp. NPDC057438 TaxID=3346133 RepID=UPI0036CC4E76
MTDVESANGHTKPANTRRVPESLGTLFLHVTTDLVGIPASAAQQVLQPGRSAVNGMLGRRPAVRAATGPSRPCT